jgi:Carbohydrate family 9 binding domain-like
MPRKHLVVAIAAALGLAALSGCKTTPDAMSGATAKTYYPCRFTANPITVDGKLDDAAWKKAEAITTWYPFEPEKAGPLTPSKVMLLWDADFIYVGFEFEDDDIYSYSSEADADLWLGDVAEIFFKPSTEKHMYYEFVMAPSGAMYDARYPSRGAGTYERTLAWSSGAKVATNLRGTDDDFTDDDQGYTVEVAIPLSAFAEAGKPASGATWTFGAFRYNYSKSFEFPLLMMTIPEAPVQGYHSYENYAPLRFMGGKM